jgi:Helix-turn-helix domain
MRVNWDRLVAELLHPTQIAILAAVEHVDEPLSASLLVEVLDETISLGSMDYHVKRLAHLGALVEVDERQRRGATEHFWRPAP